MGYVPIPFDFFGGGGGWKSKGARGGRGFEGEGAYGIMGARGGGIILSLQNGALLSSE